MVAKRSFSGSQQEPELQGRGKNTQNYFFFLSLSLKKQNKTKQVSKDPTFCLEDYKQVIRNSLFAIYL